MSYQPQDLDQLVPPVQTFAPSTNTPWGLAVINHNQLFYDYEPSVASWHGEPVDTIAGTERSVFRFRSSRGHDHAVAGSGIQLRVEIIARSTTVGAGGDIKLYGGSSTVTAAVSGSTFATYTLTATPAAANEEWTLALAPGAGKVLEVCSMVAYWVASFPDNRAYPSEWRQAPAQLRFENVPIHTEVAARLLNGPVLIARDRPSCVFCHLREYNLSAPAFTKSQGWSAWGIQDSVKPQIVGRGRIPIADVRTRPFFVEYFLRSSGSIAGGLIRIGGTEVSVQADAWGGFQIDLGRADADITATIDACGAGEWAYFETIQVWRMAP
jgi:hypothetical protein